MISRKYKQLVVVLAVGILVIGIAAGKFALTSKAEAPHLEKYLPATTLAFVQVYDLRAQTVHIAESEAWKEYSKTNPTAASLFLIGANHTGILDASYAIAITGLTINNGKPEPNFALVAEFSSHDSKRQFTSSVLHMAQPSKDSNSAGKSEQYGDTTIGTYQPSSSESFAYAAPGDLLIIANNSDTVKNILDARDGKIKSLGDNTQLENARSQIGYNDGMFGFVDGVALTNLIDSVPSTNQKMVATFQEFFHSSGADSTQSVAMTSSFSGGRVVERFTILAKDGGHGVFKTILNNPGTKQDLLNLIPENANVAFDGSIANAQQTFEDIATIGNKLTAQRGEPSADDLFQGILEKTGVDVRNDVIQSLGSEIALAEFSIGDIHSDAVILNLTDVDKFNHVLESLAQHDHKTITSQDYQGLQIKTVAGDKGNGLFYAFVNGNYVSRQSSVCGSANYRRFKKWQVIVSKRCLSWRGGAIDWLASVCVLRI